jgi:dsRNA-specific ribonuclease
MKCREFKQPDITITKSLSDMWESLAGALLIDGGWPAINQVLIPILMPYIEFYY